MPSAVTDNPDEARNTLRGDLIPYFSLPFYRAMIERAGFGSDIEAFDAKMKEGDAQAAAAQISDGYLETLAAIGTAEEASAVDRPLLRGRRDLAGGRPDPAHGLRGDAPGAQPLSDEIR